MCLGSCVRGRCLLVTCALLCVGSAVGAAESELRLEIGDDRLSLVAVDVPIRQILAEWAGVGDTQIVNLDQVSGPPVTLELRGVPESQALDIVLRSVAGYVAAPRRPGDPGLSGYGRILILARSAAPLAPPAAQ